MVYMDVSVIGLHRGGLAQVVKFVVSDVLRSAPSSLSMGNFLRMIYLNFTLIAPIRLCY